MRKMIKEKRSGKTNYKRCNVPGPEVGTGYSVIQSDYYRTEVHTKGTTLRVCRHGGKYDWL